MPSRPPIPRSLRATAIVATVGVVAALVGLVLLLRPVHSPTQDCGLAAAYLLTGRVDQYVDEAAPPKGVTKAEAKANNRRPCRPRVADAARPGLILFSAGLLVAVVAALVELVIRLWGWRKRRVAAR
ncbi:MAG: hypothetical protein U0P45_04670 [Acidimicrobiales bacterium]